MFDFVFPLVREKLHMVSVNSTQCLQYRIIHLLKGGVERTESDAIYSSPHKFLFKEMSRN